MEPYSNKSCLSIKSSTGTKQKNYNLLFGLKQNLFVFALIVFSVNMHAQATYTFNYTGAIQTMNLAAGSYSIQMWGADGEQAVNQPAGGIGGYSAGTYSTTSPVTIYIGVGGKGSLGPTSAAFANGGFNGGGNGYGSTVIGAGGGGASHIATATGALPSLSTNQSAVIIVAGGAGGSGYAGAGGNGGGLAGGNGNTGLGGTTGSPFGQGAVGTTAGTCGGGGGGWFGGGLGSPGNTGGAGGGSGYIGGVTSGVTAQTGQAGFVTRPNTAGNGLVLITELCNISLMASGANSLNPVICSGQSLTLTTNAISNYVWSTGATTSSLVVAPTTNTVYTLTATSPSNCTASKSISVTVSNAQPTLSVTQSTNQTCLGKTATLTASGAVNYTWTNGVTNGVSFYPSATQTYTVTGDNGCGTVQAVSTITVSPLALSVVSSATAVCTNKTATLSATAAATSYTWNPGNIIGASPNLIVNPQANTVYTVTATDGTCVGVTNISLQADPVPTITSSSSSTLICPGGTVNLSATGGINYTWTPVNMNGASITASPNISTLFTVQGDNSFGCLNSSSQVIVVGTQPTLGVSTNASTICDGGSATLTANGANGYAWTGGPITNSYVVSPNQNTTYTIVGTNTTSGCTDMKTISISVFSPSLAVTGSTAICNGASSNLSATGGVSYTWNPGGLPFQGISVTPSSNSVYTVSGIASQGALNCPVSATIQVNVNPTPTITAVANPTAICPKQSATITAGGADTYTWVGTNTTIVNSSINVSAPSVSILVYTLTGTNAQGCESSINVPFNISACTGISLEGLGNNQMSVYPNPNNGEFTIMGQGNIILKLINELGQVIKELKLSDKDTNSVALSNLPPGVYFLVGDNISSKIVVTK